MSTVKKWKRIVRSMVVLAAVGGWFCLAGCELGSSSGSSGGSGPSTVGVSIIPDPTGLASSQAVFSPVNASVHRGDVVQWVNQDMELHTITVDPANVVAGGPDSDTQFPDGMSQGAQFNWIVPTNATSGSTWFYHCRFDGSPGNGSSLGVGMVGSVTVQ